MIASTYSFTLAWTCFFCVGGGLAQSAYIDVHVEDDLGEILFSISISDWEFGCVLEGLQCVESRRRFVGVLLSFLSSSSSRSTLLRITLGPASALLGLSCAVVSTTLSAGELALCWAFARCGGDHVVEQS